MYSPKRICLVIHSLGIGGMERVMSQLANHFAGRKHAEVHLILIGIKRNIAYPLHDSIIVHRPPFLFNNRRRKIDTIRTMRFLRRTIKELNPYSILSFGEIWNNLVLLSLYGLDYPIYVSDRSQPDKDLGQVHNMLRNELYPKTAGYIAQTEKAASICKSNGWCKNVKVIGNPIRKINTNGQEKKEDILLSVGRLIKTKHFDQLIRIFIEIANPNWKLVIVGGDAQKQTLSKELKKLIQELGVGDRVFLEGEQKDIDLYYKRSKIFAFTSSSEGFPNVIGEALSAGLPVVAFDCIAGPSDMVKDGKNGFLVPLFDQVAFREKLTKLIEDEELRKKMGDEAKESIRDFDVSFIAEEYYEFIFNIHEDRIDEVELNEIAC